MIKALLSIIFVFNNLLSPFTITVTAGQTTEYVVWEENDTIITQNKALDLNQTGFIPNSNNELVLFDSDSQVKVNDRNDNHLYSDHSCVTTNGQNGTCKLFSECYPFINTEAKRGQSRAALAKHLAEYLGFCVSSKFPGYTKRNNYLFFLYFRYVFENYDEINPDLELLKICCPQSSLPPSAAASIHVRKPRYNHQQFVQHHHQYWQQHVINRPGPVQQIVQVPFIRNNKCGQRLVGGPAILTKVINGYIAWRGGFPWTVALLGPYQFCGGSIIDEWHILTAAHCLTGRNVNGITVVLGAQRINGGQYDTRRVTRSFWPTDYNAQTLANDIGILRLNRPIVFSKYVQPICLSNSYSQGNLWGEVAGWGRFRTSGPQSNELRFAQIKVWDQNSCRQTYRNNRRGFFPIYDSNMCASGRNQDTCSGDSGGPLTIRRKDGAYEQIGIVSWATIDNCGWKPGVYTRVSSHTRWINWCLNNR